MSSMRTWNMRILDGTGKAGGLWLCFCFLFPFQSPAAGPPPVIIVQPLDQTALCGRPAIFTVVPGSSDTTLSYQWYKNNKALKGQTSSTLTLTNVSNLDQGEYYVDVKNSGGTVSSRKATLTVVNIPPVANNDSY